MAGDLAGGVGDVHDLGRRGAVLAAEDAVPEPEVERGADHDDEVAAAERLAAGLGDQQRVAAGTTPRPMPLVIVGMPADSTKRSAASSARSAHTSVPRISTGREADGQQLGDLGDRVAVGLLRRGRGPTAGAGPEAELKNSSIGTSTNDRAAVRRAGGGERVVHAVEHVAGGVEGAGRLRDRRDDRRLVELLQAAAAPAVGRRATADDDHRRAGELGLGDRAEAVGDARAGGEHGEPGHPGQLAGGLGGERRGLLVAYVEQPHRRVGLDRAVVHREHVRAGQGEHRLDPVGAGDGDGELAGVPAQLRLVGGGVVGHGRRLLAGINRRTDRSGLRCGEEVRVGALQASTSTEQQVGAHVGWSRREASCR